MQGAQTQQQLRQGGYYSHINNAPRMESPKAVYWDRGIGNTDPLHGPNEAASQQQFRQQGMYSQINNVVGRNPRLGDSLYGPNEVRSPSGFIKQGMYPRLFNVATKRTLGEYFGDAASATMPGLLVAAGLVIAYFLFFKKEKPHHEKKSHHVEKTAEAEKGFSFYY